MQHSITELPDLNQKTGVGRLSAFLSALRKSMADLPNDDVRERTTGQRVARRYSVREAAEFLDVDATYLSQLTKEEEFPSGDKEKRDRRFSVADIMRMRAMLASRSGARKKFLHWRTPGTNGNPNMNLPVVSFSSQKGGTAKTVSAAHFAQYLTLFYGLRVGVIDADPQATISLYFAGEPHEVHYHKANDILVASQNTKIPKMLRLCQKFHSSDTLVLSSITLSTVRKPQRLTLNSVTK